MPEPTATSPLPRQGQDLIYALDIGTRSVIGMLGRREDGRVRILAMEKLLHAHRVMMDGQIEDIAQVAAAVRTVTDRLEQDAGCRLERACVAAAGRALRTAQGCGTRELPAPEVVTETTVAQLEAAAVAEAERSIHTDEENGQQLLLVGYTATQYRLDGYPLTSLLGHTGRVIEAQVVATFLPGGVIDSLYAVMRRAGLEVASLTLEPIAALNAAIPADLRLLNLCLVDIGAGTSDIAVCRDGSVVGYTMATVAGDEITEALMREYLVDYNSAESIKAQLSQAEKITFTDILGQEQTCSLSQVQAALGPAIELLAREIAQHVLDLNGAAPSALFLAGGGSKLAGLQAAVASALDMDPKRVAVAGGHFKTTSCSDVIDLDDPEYTTPLGIAVSAGLGLVSDSCRVTLNGAPAKLFRSGDLSAMDLLMMNGYTYFDLLGRIGRPLVIQVDGRRTVFYGQPALPARLVINGAEAQPSAIVHPGDVVEFTPAQAGEDCRFTAEQLARRLKVDRLTINGERPSPDAPVPSGAFVVTLGTAPASGDRPAAATDASPADLAGQAKEAAGAGPHPERDEAGVLSPASAPAPAAAPVEPGTAAASAEAAAPADVGTSAAVTAAEAHGLPGAGSPAATAESDGRAAGHATAPEAAEPLPAVPAGRPCKVRLNGRDVTLPPKKDGTPHYVMDLLELSGIDFKNARGPVALQVNGSDCLFQQVLQEGDQISIGYEDEVNVP